MKDVTSCIMPGRGACNLWTRDFRMRLRNNTERWANAGDGNILVPAGKEIKRDAASISERTQHKANWICYSNIIEMWCCRTFFYPNQLIWTPLERGTAKGDSPVRVSWWILSVSWISYLGYGARNWESSTSNLKYFSRPIEQKYREGKLKRTLDRESKDLET